MADIFLGEIRTFAFGRVPSGWAPCQGQLLSISRHAALFSLIGTTYGGDGRSTFALPDLRGASRSRPASRPRGPRTRSATTGARRRTGSPRRSSRTGVTASTRRRSTTHRPAPRHATDTRAMTARVSPRRSATVRTTSCSPTSR